MQIFPIKEIDNKTKNINSMIFGNRFRSDQTLYEYLIEFLLIFVSAKDEDFETGKMKFHNLDDNYSYWVQPRMGLKRFIFYDKSKKGSSIEDDEKAFKKLNEILYKKMEDINEEDRIEILEALQDLYHGYAVILKNRNWCAQALLPICEELIFCEAMPNEKNRKRLVKFDINPKSVDIHFELSQRNFLARGGEVYYLHLLQHLCENKDDKDKLEKLLQLLLNNQSKKMSDMANFIQNAWEEECGFTKEELHQKYQLSYIPIDAYSNVSKYSVEELINYLSNKIHPINKIDLLAKGIMFQIMRMQMSAIYSYLDIEPKKMIVDMRGTNNDSVKKIASINFKLIEDDFMTAINRKANELTEIQPNELMKKIQEAKKHSLDIFRTKGKELQCIIPYTGAYERFSLSEDIIKFLVLSIIKPSEKMTLDRFLEKLYEHYGIIIGPEQYRKSLDGGNLDNTLISSFNDNLDAFQIFLKNTGFLRELSDATSIVENPYESEEE